MNINLPDLKRLIDMAEIRFKSDEEFIQRIVENLVNEDFENKLKDLLKKQVPWSQCELEQYDPENIQDNNVKYIVHVYNTRSEAHLKFRVDIVSQEVKQLY
jgi:hypothetical protein